MLVYQSMSCHVHFLSIALLRLVSYVSYVPTGATLSPSNPSHESTVVASHTPIPSYPYTYYRNLWRHLCFYVKPASSLARPRLVFSLSLVLTETTLEEKETRDHLSLGNAIKYIHNTTTYKALNYTYLIYNSI